MAIRSVVVRIEGRVQGVGFRAWTRREAVALGLGGAVRNHADGSVEAEIEGEAPAVAAMLDKCRRGPTHADVASIAVEERPCRHFTDFTVVRGW